MPTNIFYTNRAQQTMLSQGLLGALVNGYYRLGDFNKIYSVTGNTVPTVEATGTKTILTNEKCTSSTLSGGGIPRIPQTISVAIANKSRAIVNFRASDCDGGLYTLSGDTNILDININIHTYINNLTNLLAAPYSTTSRGVTFNVWDFLEATIQEWNLVDKIWEYKDSITAFNIAWQFNSKEDLINWKKLNYFNYVKRGAIRGVIREDGIYPSTLILSPSNYTSSGAFSIQGSGFKFSLGPSYYFYRLITKDGIIIDTKTLKEGDNLVTQNGTGFYKAIIPGAYVAGINRKFFMKDTTKYPSEFDKTFGELYSWRSDDDKQLGVGLLEALILFFKTTGKLHRVTNTYNIHTNWKMNTTSSTSFNSMEKIGGKVMITWVYDPNNTGSNISDLITFNK